MLQDILAGIIVGFCVWVAARAVYRRFRRRRMPSRDCGCGCDGCSLRETCGDKADK